MANRNGLKWQIPFLLLLIVGTVLILRKQAPYQTDQGLVFGTMYKITYQSKENLKTEIEAELQKVDRSLSPFNKQSVITHINNNTDMQADSLFAYVFRLAKQISDSLTIDSLRQFVGFEKIRLEDGKVIKSDPRTMLDCSAIAKGFGVDCVARLLDRKGVRNYMIDIGGELVMKGENSKMQPWRIGINKPIDDSLAINQELQTILQISDAGLAIDDSLAINQELQTILQISDAGLATSGNYRNFYYKDGKKYAHTIDPRTGYPIQHNILSATVVAQDCATADAYATSFMVLGLDSAKAICNAHPELDAYFIYTKEDGKTDVYYTEGMKRYIVR